MGIDPERDAGKTGCIRNRRNRRPLQKFCCIEDVVDFLILEQPVRVNASPGDVEVSADERGHRRYLISDFFLIIFGKICDHGGVHAVQAALKLRILKYHRLKRCIPCSLSDAEQGAVDAAAAIQPGGRSIDDSLVEVIVSVPLNLLVRNSCVGVQSINYSRNRAGNDGAGIIDAESERIAGSHFDRNAIFLLQLHQLQAERYDISVYIGPRDILQMTARADAFLETLPHNGEIMIHRLPSGHFQLHENVIIGARNQNSGLLEAQLLHQLIIFFLCANPAGHLRILITTLQTLTDGIPVFFAVEEKFGGADHAVRPAQAVKLIVDMDNLLCRIGRPRLLTVPERSVRDPDVLRHIVRNNSVVERNLRNFLIREHIVEDVRFLHVVQNVHMLLNRQEVVIAVHRHRAIFEPLEAVRIIHHGRRLLSSQNRMVSIWSLILVSLYTRVSLKSTKSLEIYHDRQASLHPGF